MTGLRTTAVFSAVQILVICAGLGFGSVGWGQQTVPCSAKQDPSSCNNTGGVCTWAPDLSLPNKGTCSGGSNGSPDTFDCTQAVRDYNSAVDEADKSCTEAGYKSNSSSGDLGNPSGLYACKSKFENCLAKAPSSGTVDTGALDQILSAVTPNYTPSTSSASKKPGGCPQLNSTDYFTQSDKLQTEIDTAKKEQADITKEIATDKKDSDEALAQAKKDIAQAVKDLNKFTTDNNKDQRDAAAAALKKQQDDTTALGQLNSAILKKQGEVSNYESSYAQQMLQYTDQLNQLTCLSQVKAARAEMTKQGLFSATGGISTSAASANSQKAALQASWDTCIAGLKLKRQKLEQDRATYLQQAQQEIQSDNAAVDQANQTLKSDSDNAAAALADLKTSLTNEQQSTFTTEQNLQSEAQNKMQTIQQEQAALQQKQAVISARIAQLQQKLDNLGPEPAPNAKSAPADATDAVIKMEKMRQRAGDACCALKAQMPKAAMVLKCGADGQLPPAPSTGAR